MHIAQAGMVVHSGMCVTAVVAQGYTALDLSPSFVNVSRMFCLNLCVYAVCVPTRPLRRQAAVASHHLERLLVSLPRCEVLDMTGAPGTGEVLDMTGARGDASAPCGAAYSHKACEYGAAVGLHSPLDVVYITCSGMCSTATA